MGWKAVASCEVGISHQKLDLPCQDYADYCVFPEGVIVGVVSDGAGSAKYSDQGSKWAVTTVLESFKNLVDAQQIKNKQHDPSFALEDAQEYFTKLVKQVRANLEERANLADYRIEDLSCTLLVFIATPEGLIAMQIGDGFMVVRTENEGFKLLFQPDKGEYANETTFVTSASALEDMQVIYLAEPVAFICASSDGLEKVAIKLSDYSAYDRFFQPLETYLANTEEPKEEDYLKPFLQLEDLNKRTDDDKSLLIALYDKNKPCLI